VGHLARKVVRRGGDANRPDANGSSGTRGRLTALARTAAHRALLYPDPQIGWYPGALRAGRELLREQRFDAIYSSSNPITAHLVARALSRRAGLPWVAEFRDPWSFLLPKRPHRARAERLERRIAQEATTLVMPTPKWATHFGQVWGREVAVVPNGYDRELDPAPRPTPPVMTHLGTYYPERQDFGLLWSAIAEIRANDPESAPVIRFVGDLPHAARGELERAGIADLVEVTGFLPHEQAKAQLAASSVLLGVDVEGDGPVELGVVPAKLYEYLASDVPIVYVANPGSDAAAILKDVPGCHVVQKGDLEGARNALLHAFAPDRFPRAASAFSRSSAARKLRDVLDGAVR
jgi:hypothetical protein